MAIARLNGGPLDGQLVPLEGDAQDKLIVPFSETHVVYHREGDPANTGDNDGATEIAYRFAEAQDDIVPGDDRAPGE